MFGMDPKQRFSSRVENYVKYRPGYPAGVIQTLRTECGLSPESMVADFGSGTGLLARLFLEFGCTVYGVEPNAEMRAAGERLLAGYPRFHSLDGSAESAPLPAGSVDFATAGQAFHWFDPAAARAEFLRILRPGGWAALIWNERSIDATPFLRAYEDMLQRYGTDYREVTQRNVQQDGPALQTFFGNAFRQAHFEYLQRFDFTGVKGRLLSSSYVPEEGHPNHEPMLAELRRIFDQHQQDGEVSIVYDTVMYYGRLAEE